MGKNAKPRKKYVPRPKLQDPVNYVLRGYLPLCVATAALRTLHTKVHGSVDNLAHGRGSAADIKALAEAFTISQAFSGQGIGEDLTVELDAAQEALLALAERAKATGNFTLKGPELTALNLGVEVYDAQLEVATLGEFEKAAEAAAKALRKGVQCT